MIFAMLKFQFLFCSAQMLMKARLKGAQKGHSLLKKKADALQMRFRMILSKIIEVRLPTVLIFDRVLK
jgi:vacuolar-type H+-ATPase subunit D/Vma8